MTTTPIDRESVEQALAELEDLVRCRCHEAYRGRGLHDPDCHCDSSDAVATVRALLEALEAKLAKVTAAYRIEAMRRDDYSHEAFDQHIAQITGETDE